jgi:hypothetical protein
MLSRGNSTSTCSTTSSGSGNSSGNDICGAAHDALQAAGGSWGAAEAAAAADAAFDHATVQFSPPDDIMYYYRQLMSLPPCPSGEEPFYFLQPRFLLWPSCVLSQFMWRLQGSRHCVWVVLVHVCVQSIIPSAAAWCKKQRLPAARHEGYTISSCFLQHPLQLLVSPQKTNQCTASLCQHRATALNTLLLLLLQVLTL